ncbi:GNAT family N-acetyltransferase [Neogemmobacter tilapiae]|uniref:N-acetyltransferase n=1 Tax=Neogemmobacter tilapiae TaxID=875041 RepID=A0A918TH36_9RHOB|nr:GNAT family N-acetyltransferase [Gemmobacter tilapiae]GHC47837.1 N-acetyltransferase [Gemmobacter tilapiae]
MTLIRQAVAADEAVLRRCVEAAFAPYVERIGRRPAPMDADFAGQIAAGQIRVATDPLGHVVGYVTFFPQGDQMLLDALAVLPTAAGRGVGKKLVACCEDKTRAEGLAKVTLCTNAKMVENLAIYPHLGYVETGRGVEDGFDRVFFEKSLAPA